MWVFCLRYDEVLRSEVLVLGGKDLGRSIETGSLIDIELKGLEGMENPNFLKLTENKEPETEWKLDNFTLFRIWLILAKGYDVQIKMKVEKSVNLESSPKFFIKKDTDYIKIWLKSADSLIFHPNLVWISF